MTAKPFSIQSPEEIAKEYGGNKQKIAQAMQLGIVDSTAGVLAGMFIDKMRSAQMQEQAQQPTIAQQVMGGAQPAPPAATPSAGGLGAASQGAPPMTPPGAPQGAPPPAAPPMGMAEGGMVPPYASGGGLSDLPVPDTMFDEPDTGGYGDGYANGGLVAFADGGDTGGYTSGPMGPWFEAEVKRIFPNAIIAGRGRTPEHNRQVGGVSGSYHIGDNALDVKPPPGMSLTEFGTALRQHFGPSIDTIFNTRGHYGHAHLEPGPELGRQVRAGNTPVPERDVATAAGRMGSLQDVLAAVQGVNRKSPEEVAAETRVRARLEERASDEDYEKQRKADMWQTLAEIGFNMASSKSPYVLQAIGEAAAAAMPGARADRKTRKAAQDRAIEGLMELGARNRKEAMEGLKVAIPVWQSGVDAEQFERKLQLSQAELGLAREKLNAEIAAANRKGIDVDTAVFQMFTSGDPAMKQVAQDYLGARYPRAVGAGGLSPTEIRANVEAGRGGSAGFSEGQTSKDTQGKTIVFQGGQWVYP